MQIKSRFILLVIAFLLVACQGGSKAAIPTPAAGKSVFTGQFLSDATGKPLANTSVRLAEVYRQGERGAYVLDAAFSPGAITDANGFYVIADLEPKEYVLVAGNVEMNNYVIVPEPSGVAKVFKTEPDAILDVGTISVKLVPVEIQTP